MWIFGYGSLIWKANFSYEQKIVGFVKGYNRRFWQGSEDHRGVPGAPGRVATLVPSADLEDCVWGVAYKISENDILDVKAYLDYREKDGYQQKTVKFYPHNIVLEPFNLEIYIGDETNPFFLGPASLNEIAEQIAQSEGPSGRNDEYLFNLASALRLYAPHVYDNHIYELEMLVKKINGK